MSMCRCPNCGEWVSAGKDHKCPPEPFNVLVSRLKTAYEPPAPIRYKTEKAQ